MNNPCNNVSSQWVALDGISLGSHWSLGQAPPITSREGELEVNPIWLCSDRWMDRTVYAFFSYLFFSCCDCEMSSDRPLNVTSSAIILKDTVYLA